MRLGWGDTARTRTRTKETYFKQSKDEQNKTLKQRHATHSRKIKQNSNVLWRRKWQPTPSSILAWRIPRTEDVHGVIKRRTRLSS